LKKYDAQIMEDTEIEAFV